MMPCKVNVSIASLTVQITRNLKLQAVPANSMTAISGSTILNSLATTVATPRKKTGLLIPHNPRSSFSTRTQVSCPDPSPAAASRQDTGKPEEPTAPSVLLA
ncbi:hypothetical protein MUK42_06136 [Musa troglodytarum]|uniref:Uncharacterized protein n=1 Tax=Musa troglodytarum TaxID=320322 RepID=A0A9E7GMX9_9LILI|nr:hypothetical protein MUK42_06136 [Musa troglodytarum]